MESWKIKKTKPESKCKLKTEDHKNTFKSGLNSFLGAKSWYNREKDTGFIHLDCQLRHFLQLKMKSHLHLKGIVLC